MQRLTNQTTRLGIVLGGFMARWLPQRVIFVVRLIRRENVQMNALFGTLVGWVIILVVCFIIYKPLGAFCLLLAIGGNGKKWFHHNAYFYSRNAARINGFLWGVIMGTIYLALIKFMQLKLGLSIALLVWGFLATAYSGFGARVTPNHTRDGSHANLSLISGVSSLIYLAMATISLALVQ